MTTSLQLTFRDVPPSDAIRSYVRRGIDRLSATGERVIACQISIEAPHRSKHHGRHFRVRLDLAVAGGEIVVDRCPDAGNACADLYAAIDGAFDHAVRRLRERGRRQRATASATRRTRLGREA